MVYLIYCTYCTSKMLMLQVDVVLMLTLRSATLRQEEEKKMVEVEEAY